MADTQITYFVDGACPNNGTPIHTAYGSWCRVEDGVITDHAIFPLADATTNNEAEYHALLTLLREGVEHEATVYMVQQTNGHWRVREPRLQRLCDLAKQLLSPRKLEWVPRSEVERHLGH